MRSADFAAMPTPGLIDDASAAGRARVLVVDDDERNLLAIRTVIEDIAEVTVARSGEEALRHLLKDDFAVILLDVYMPGLDGYETAQIIRAREQTKRIPIVFLSAVNKEAEHLMRGYSMGAVDYVFKPVEALVIRSKVTVFVDLFTMRREIQRKAAHEQQLLDANLRANAERLAFEKELRLAEQRQAAIIESLPIVLYLETLDGGPRIPRFVTGNFTAMTGFELDELSRTPTLWADRLHPDDRNRVLAGLEARRRGGAPSVEYRWCCADGGYKHFLDHAVLLSDASGKPIEYAGTLLDVTERRVLEDQLAHVRKLDAIGQLTGGIAHDFNNLLAAVLGGVGLIERRIPLDDGQRRVVEMMRHAAEQGTELVKRLLAFARRATLEPAPIAVDSLAQAVSDLLAHTLGGLVQLEWRIGEQIGQVYADAGQLELALMNLVINARDSMPDGGVVTVTAENRVVAAAGEGDVPVGRYVVLTVADTGCGIPEELVDQVLEPFFTTKEVGKGTGLGLSMVYGFVKQSGGTMRIESVVGAGTRIELWLPMVLEPVGAPTILVAKPGEAHEDIGPLRILLVDDHPGVRATTAALLEDMGHAVIEADSGQAGLDAIEGGGGFDLVVSDYAMPRQSGIEMIERARAIVPGLPGVIITGYADAKSFARRPDDVVVLGKPFTPEQLEAAVRSVTGPRLPAAIDQRVAAG